jgi:hypothetical protein
MLNNAAISWRSARTPLQVLNAAEAELVGLCTATQEAVFLRKLCQELGFIQHQPTVIYEDCQAAVALGKENRFRKRSKHISLRWSYVVECQRPDINNIKAVSVSRTLMLADIFASPRSAAQFGPFRNMIIGRLHTPEPTPPDIPSQHRPRRYSRHDRRLAPAAHALALGRSAPVARSRALGWDASEDSRSLCRPAVLAIAQHKPSSRSRCIRVTPGSAPRALPRALSLSSAAPSAPCLPSRMQRPARPAFPLVCSAQRALLSLLSAAPSAPCFPSRKPRPVRSPRATLPIRHHFHFRAERQSVHTPDHVPFFSSEVQREAPPRRQRYVGCAARLASGRWAGRSASFRPGPRTDGKGPSNFSRWRR